MAGQFEDEAYQPFPILEEHAEAAALFLAVCSQWRMGPLGGFIGLDWHFVDLELRHGGHEITTETWQGLKTMERAACRELNRKDG